MLITLAAASDKSARSVTSLAADGAAGEAGHVHTTGVQWVVRRDVAPLVASLVASIRWALPSPAGSTLAEAIQRAVSGT